MLNFSRADNFTHALHVMHVTNIMSVLDSRVRHKVMNVKKVYELHVGWILVWLPSRM